MAVSSEQGGYVLQRACLAGIALPSSRLILQCKSRRVRESRGWITKGRPQLRRRGSA